ncbi:MAG: PHP domain-containing protein [Thermodesulfobacteriota bacterium]
MEKGAQGPLRTLHIDTHTHSCLSPCATLDMTPINIVREAVKRNLAIIAITDHNSAENTPAVMAAAAGTELNVIPGMEITTAEEAHVIGLFDDVKSALTMQALVYANLFPGENDADIFGLQVVANEFDEVETINTRLLIGGTHLSVNDVVNAIHECGGLAIAAHIDRQSFSVISQLGFIPDALPFDALEVSRRLPLKEARAHYPEYGNFAFISASDAHDLSGIASAPTRIRAAGPTTAELKMALKGVNGRKILE